MQQRVFLCHPSLLFFFKQPPSSCCTSVKIERKSRAPFFFLRSQCAAVHLRLYQPGGAVSYGVGRAAGWPEELLALTSVGQPGVLSVT